MGPALTSRTIPVCLAKFRDTRQSVTSAEPLNSLAAESSRCLCERPPRVWGYRLWGSRGRDATVAGGGERSERGCCRGHIILEILGP